MKSIYIIPLAFISLVSCVGVKELPKGALLIPIDELEEKTTQGNEKIIGVGIVPPGFGNLYNTNSSIGLFSTYNSFTAGNVYADIQYYPNGLKILGDPNVETNTIPPVSSVLNYSFPLIKFSKTINAYIEFDRDKDVIKMYKTDICYKKSINLRFGNSSLINQFNGEDMDTDNPNEFRYLTFKQRQNFITAGLSYNIFLDHQCRIVVEGNESRNIVNQFAEFYFDLNFAYNSKIEQVITPGYQYLNIADQSADFEMKSIGYHFGIKYNYITKKRSMIFHLGYAKLPGYIYRGAYSNSTKLFNSTFVIGFQIGLANYLNTPGRIFRNGEFSTLIKR